MLARRIPETLAPIASVALVALAVLAVLLVGACASESTTTHDRGRALERRAPQRSPVSDGVDASDATVTRVVDGDTVVVRLDGRDATVRLIGIDTPETKDPRRPVQCFGREAAARTMQLLPAGTAVRVVYDVERHDRYGRTLGYLYRSTGPDDGRFVNATLVRDGYASVATFPPNVAHADEFVVLQREARGAGRGLWGACPVGAGPSAAEDGGSGCDPAYPDACIPPAPPDLDCGDVGARSFRVLAPDPHRFDSNRDGVGCEGS